MINNIHSNAFNYGSFMSTGVDLRTGQYTVNIDLVTLKPYNLENPTERVLSISYSALRNSNSGFGIGWQLSRTYLDFRNNQFHTIDGESYSFVAAPVIGGEMVFRDRKLLNFRVRRINNNTYEYTHKDGIIETLLQEPTSSLALTSSLAFENGETFDFVYGHRISGERFLTSITHRQTRIIQLTLVYNGLNCINFSYPVDDGVIAAVRLVYNNNLLTTLSLPFNQATGIPQNYPQYQMTYQSLATGYRVITELRKPTGAREMITHNAQGLRATTSLWVPAVTSHRTIPGNGQPDMLKQYQYSPVNNFLGFNSTKTNFQEGIDNLYLIRTPYDYWGRETHIQNNQNLMIVEEHFNRFHLMTREIITRGNSRTTRTITYNEQPGNIIFENQPANLQLPSRSVVRYEEISSGQFREEVEETQTDDSGNALFSRDSRGISKRYTFYPREGVSGSCPPDPLGFTRFIREIRINPPGDITPVVPDKITEYTYRTHPNILNNGSNYVVKASERMNSAARVEYEYQNTLTDVRVHGLLSLETYTMNNLVTRKRFEHRFLQELLVTDITTTGFDNAVLQSTSSKSWHTGKILEYTDTVGVRKGYRFNIWGQLAAEIFYSNEGEIRRLCDYTFPVGNESAVIETVTESSGVRERTIYDGLGRVNRIEKQDDDAVLNPNENYNGTFRTVQEKTYNTLNELATETEMDWYWTGEGSNTRQATPSRLVKTYTYDGWGNISRVQSSSGMIWVEDHNEITNTIVSGIENQARLRSRLNRFGEIESMELLRRDGTVYSTRRAAYDGFGRKISETDALNNTIRYTYDSFDRIVTKILPDDTVQQLDYAPFSHEENVSSIRVNNTLFGQLQYDGVGRVIQETSGGRIKRYGYQGGSLSPDQITQPDSIIINAQYNHLLGDAPTRVETPNSEDNYEYNNRMAELTRAHNLQFESTMEHFPSGYKSREQFRAGTNIRNSTYRYSTRGELQFSTDYYGNSEACTYDQFGRLATSTKNGVRAEFHYWGTINKVRSIIYSGTGIQITVDIAYDEFTREMRRTTTTGGVTRVLHLEYNVNDKVSRKRFLQNNVVLSDETYAYDINSRLSEWRFDNGSNRPHDSSGRALFRQIYTNDQWGNIATLRNHYASTHEDIVYRFSSTDPTQLISITNGSNVIQLQYDNAGRLTRDEQGRRLVYNAKGRLIRLENSGGQTICEYQYDAMDNLVAQIVPGGNRRDRYYMHDILSNLQDGNEVISYINSQENPFSSHQSEIPVGQHSSTSGITLYESDQNNTILAVNPGQNTLFSYTPYGFRSLISTLPGFTGAVMDPITGWYFFGNGYRVYNPVLMRFHTPDDLSPFGRGGINPYTYCDGDPVNSIDPSGHMSLENIGYLIISLLTLAAMLFATGIFAKIGAIFKGKAIALKAVKAAKIAAKAVKATKVGTVAKKAFTGISAASEVLNISAIIADETGDDTAARGLLYASGALGLLSGLPAVTSAARPAKAVSRITFKLKHVQRAFPVIMSSIDTAAYINTVISLEASDDDTADATNRIALGLTFVSFMAGTGIPAIIGGGRSLRSMLSSRNITRNAIAEVGGRNMTGFFGIFAEFTEITRL